MTDYKEVKTNLFTINKGIDIPYCLAHCISSDFAMAGGIALDFVRKWHMRNKLRWQYGNQECEFTLGTVLPIQVEDYEKSTLVYNLVTKRYVYQQPDYANIIEVLRLMREDMLGRGLTKVAMPKIGCGIDGLEWTKVSEIIQQVFNQTGIEVRVCHID